MEVSYEPGFQSPPHAHRVDEIFYLLHGGLSVNGHELTPGSVLYVPSRTKYGPEYALEDGAHILRVELWSAQGRSGHTPPRAAWKAWSGPMTGCGTPDAQRPTAVPARSEREGGDAPDVTSASPPDSWEEASVDCRTRRVSGPTPDVLEVQLAAEGFQAIEPACDLLLYVLDGTLSVGGHDLAQGSACVVPEGMPQRVTAAAEARYLRVALDGVAPT